MTSRVVRPSGRGFLMLDAHPVGCARVVDLMAADSRPAGSRPDHPDHPDRPDRPVTLVIGSSAGYGLAATLTGVVRHGMRGVAVAHERPPTGRRSASAGWYRSVRTAEVARQHGSELTLVNADCFREATREQVLDLVARRFGRVDRLLYSVAAPRRPAPRTGEPVESVIKPVGAPHRARMLSFEEGRPVLREETVRPATDEQRRDTVSVMGGEDWEEWVTALAERGLLGTGFRTVALSYVGPELTEPVYRHGTIGAAKAHLEQTARSLTAGVLGHHGGSALTAVCGAAVTAASSAIPGMALYLAVLRRTLREGTQSPAHQMARLWELLMDPAAPATDAAGRIRLDDWEMRPEVQQAVARSWEKLEVSAVAADPALLDRYADTDWLAEQAQRLYGFAVPGVDYAAPAEVDIPWPVPPALTPSPAGPASYS